MLVLISVWYKLRLLRSVGGFEDRRRVAWVRPLPLP